MSAHEAIATAGAMTFDMWGVPATYRPQSGPELDCIILQDSRAPKGPEEFTSKPVTTGWVIRVRRSEVASPSLGGVFVVDGETYAVTGAPYHEDPDRVVWVCEVA